MIEPSSSEEDEDEVVDAPPQGPPRGQNQVKVPNGNVKATPADGTTSGGNADLKIEKVTSPTSSQNSEKNLTEAELRVSRITYLFFNIEMVYMNTIFMLQLLNENNACTLSRRLTSLTASFSRNHLF